MCVQTVPLISLYLLEFRVFTCVAIGGADIDECLAYGCHRLLYARDGDGELNTWWSLFSWIPVLVRGTDKQVDDDTGV